MAIPANMLDDLIDEWMENNPDACQCQDCQGINTNYVDWNGWADLAERCQRCGGHDFAYSLSRASVRLEVEREYQDED